jgi:hypothetical protein
LLTCDRKTNRNKENELLFFISMNKQVLDL